jgi:solute:Na+ symporter, SSS family
VSGELAGILAYVILQLAIGVAVSRRIATEADYLLAGRSLGYSLATFSIFATWLGAETCIGSARSIYEEGLSWTTPEPFAYSACLLFMGVVFAAPLWRRGLTTVVDLFRERFGPGVERFVVLLVVPTSVLWAAAQLRAFGQVLAASSDLSLQAAIGFAAAVAVVYTAFGGLLADAVTDLVQGIALIGGLLLLGGVLLSEGALLGAGAVGGAGAASGPATGADPSWLAVAEAWSIPVFGSVFAQELVSRVLGSRSPKVAVRAAAAGAVGYLAIGLVPVSAGLAGAIRFPGLEDPEQILLHLAHAEFHGVLYVIFAGALVSAILSTVDSTLLASASIASHNLIVPLRRGIGETGKLRVARAGVVVFGAAAYGLALSAGSVLELVEQASAFGSAGVFVAGCFALFTRFGGAPSAYACLAAGALTWLAGGALGLVAPYLASLAAALGAYLALGLAVPAGLSGSPRRLR